MSWVESSLQERRLGRYRRARIEVRSESLPDAQQVRETLAGFAGSGWVCSCSEAGELRAGEGIRGVPLSAELYRESDGASLHLRQSEDGWQRIEIREHPDDTEDAHWIERVELAGFGGGTLLYDTAWRRDEDDVWHPWLSRFVGKRD